MKRDLIEKIQNTSALLKKCGWLDHARWYDSIQIKISQCDPASNQFISLLDKLDRSIGGMGSFSDVPLQSPDGSQTDYELRIEQNQIAEDLYNAIEFVRRKLSA